MSISIAARKNDFYDVWHRFFHEGSAEGVPEKILASWLRSRNHGISHEMPTSPVTIDRYGLEQQFTACPVPQDVVQAHLKRVKKHLDQVPLVVYFANADGCILNLSGHDKMLGLFDQSGLKEGTYIREDTVGTSAPGISLVEGRSCSVIGAEHYCQVWHRFSCLGAPVYDHKRSLVGVLNLSTILEDTEKLLFLKPLVESMAEAIGLELALRAALKDLELYGSYFHSHFQFSDKILLLVDAHGRLMDLNKRANHHFAICPRDLANKDVMIGLGTSVSLDGLLKCSKQPALLDKTLMGPISARTLPVSNRSGRDVGYVLEIQQQQQQQKTSVGAPDAFPRKARYEFEDIIGQSDRLDGIIRKARRVARTSSSVLLEGESGVGKELFAQAIHQASNNRDGPFVAVNCCAIPDELIESEFFGYEKGAFTGAKKEGNIGKFELANGGTLFLDEIQAMNKPTQAKLLRVLEDHQITRLGGSKPVSLNLRIISASSVSLADEVKNGAFTEALFFRLNVVRFHIPSLRERREDIPLLVEHFIDSMNGKFARHIQWIEPAAMEVLSSYTWPGNIRELRNCMEYAFNLCDGATISVEDLPEQMLAQAREEVLEGLKIELMTKRMITEALSQADTIKEAAERLGIPLSTLYRKMKRFGFSKGDN